MPHLCLVPLEELLFCCAGFGYTIASDLRQKEIKFFLRSSPEQMAMRSFLGISSSFA